MATLLDLVLKASLLIIVAGVINVLMRRASAASRHVALTAALGAAVLLPAARWALPTLPLFVFAAEPQPATAPPPPAAFAPVTEQFVLAEPNTVGPIDPPVPSAPSPEFVRASSPSWSWPSVLGILWLLGTATILVRMTVAGIRIRRLTRDAQPIDDARVNARLLEIKTQFGVTRPITLVVCAHEWMPLTWGLMRPTILLPASAAAWVETHPMRLDAVLLHEMAHIARWDAAWQRVARAAVAIFWFNPLVWIAARRARLERERACDDAVLAQGLRATDYASDLVTIAQTLVLPSRATESALAMARRAQLEQRVEALLDSRLSHRRASRVSRMLAIALIALMLPMSAAKLAARPRAALEASVIGNGARGLQTPGHVPESQSLALVQPPPVANPQSPRTTPSAAPSAPTNDSVAANLGPMFGIAWRPDGQSTSLLSQAGKWALERDAMFRLLTERARTYVNDAKRKITIGTAAPVDIKPLEDTLALVVVSALDGRRHCAAPDPFANFGGGTCVNGAWRAGTSATSSFIQVNRPTDADIAEVKKRFSDAMRNLDAAEVRWDNGMITTQELSAVVTAALKVLTEIPPGSEPIHYVAAGTHTVVQPADHLFTAGNFPGSTGLASYVSASPSDADLLEMLRGAATVKDDVKRADALLELSARYAFTPEMVTLYVTAARGLTSAAQQARVFAQAIRVK